MSNVKNRPVSPHATIYRVAWAMTASFTHRITGVVLTTIGTLVLTWYLVAVASGPQAYAQFGKFATSWLGRLILMGISWSLFQHIASGIRHLIFDLGYGFQVEVARRSAILTFVSSIVLTTIFWGYVLLFR
jgi:succinate dehydrogenase / fumarate reductase cytochrome b subunit